MRRALVCGVTPSSVFFDRRTRALGSVWRAGSPSIGWNDDRKNHYGSKSRRGTEAAATFYTLIETGKLAGVDPAQYLREAALADAHGEVLLPSDCARFNVCDRASGPSAGEA